MNRPRLGRPTLLLACGMLLGAASFAQERSNHLERLSALVGETWICTSWDGEKPKHGQSFRWEKILEGNAIREVMEVTEIGFRREGLFYWDAERRELVSLIVTNNGFLGHGTVSFDDGKIVFLGKMVGPDGGTMEQKETLELLSDEKLQFVSYLPSDTGWVERHVLEYTRREE